MYFYGSFIRLRWELDQEETLHRDEYEIIITFVGAGIAMLLYVSHLFKDIEYFPNLFYYLQWTSLMFWPCFRRKEDYDDA